jgi:L-asparaginase
VDIHIGDHVRRPLTRFEVDARFDASVLFLHATPGLEPTMLRNVMSTPGLKAIVLAAFGTGTLPRSVRPLVPEIEMAVDRGLDVLIITTSSGCIDFGLYKNSLDLAKAGAISGGEMRIEAAMTKMMHALAVFDDRNDRRVFLQSNIAGET